MIKLNLKLFIIGQSCLSKRAIKNLEMITSLKELKGMCEYEVIDLLEHQSIAEKEKILATPLLVRKLPLPEIRIIGDLSNTQKVLTFLQIFEIRNEH